MRDDDPYFQAIATAVLGGPDEGVIPIVGAKFAHRVEAHRGNFHMSARSAIVSAYPVVERLVGEEYMQGLAAAYVKVHPPIVASLTSYGNEFPAFLRGFAPVQNELPWLPAVADLDRVWFDVYEAPDDPVLTSAELIGTSPAMLPMLAPGLVAAAQLMRFKICAYSVWRTNKADAKVAEIAITSDAEWALLWRNDNQMHHTKLAQAEYVFLNNVQAGQSFAQAYAESCRFDPKFDLQQQFSRWLSAGIFKRGTT